MINRNFKKSRKGSPTSMINQARKPRSDQEIFQQAGVEEIHQNSALKPRRDEEIFAEPRRMVNEPQKKARQTSLLGQDDEFIENKPQSKPNSKRF